MPSITSTHTSLERRLAARGPFSLEQAVRFLNGFAPAGLVGQEAVYRAAHAINGRALLVQLEVDSGRLRLAVRGSGVAVADLDTAERIVRRIFSLDWDGDRFIGEALAADPVLAGLQRRRPGLRPVLFGSVFEALCWAVIGQRISIPQAARLKAHLATARGATVALGGAVWRAFPAPADLADLDPARDAAGLRLPALKIERLRALAQRGLTGAFDEESLVGMEPPAARRWLEESPGIGPWASEFALIRGAGHPDLIPGGEVRLRRAVQHAYALDREPSLEETARIGERWRPYRSWVAFLLRVTLQDETHEIKTPVCGATEGLHGSA